MFTVGQHATEVKAPGKRRKAWALDLLPVAFKPAMFLTLFSLHGATPVGTETNTLVCVESSCFRAFIIALYSWGVR